jgi:hypothetical protein
MVTHHRKAENIQPKNPGQFFEAVANPLLPVRIVPSRSLVLPAQIRPPHATVDQVKYQQFPFGLFVQEIGIGRS